MALGDGQDRCSTVSRLWCLNKVGHGGWDGMGLKSGMQQNFHQISSADCGVTMGTGEDARALWGQDHNLPKPMHFSLKGVSDFPNAGGFFCEMESAKSLNEPFFLPTYVNNFPNAAIFSRDGVLDFFGRHFVPSNSRQLNQ